MDLIKKRSIAVLLLFTLLISGMLSQAQPLEKPAEQLSDANISHDEIINHGINFVCKENSLKKIEVYNLFDSSVFIELEQWYNCHPMVEFASLVETTITIKFVDGSYTLLMDIFSLLNSFDNKHERKSYGSTDIFSSYISDHAGRQTALILNPSEYLYSNRHCKRIINRLLSKGYNIVYLANEDVDLNYTKHDLGAEVVYMNTHAGYWDVDGDHQPDTVVIATGEYWTNKTKQIYQFEYNNSMIVEGVVRGKRFVAFTPALIEYYYDSGDLPNSMIYMATCHATYDESMADAFLESGASAYIGWTQNTVFWTNSITSVLAFRLFTRGFTVKQVCGLIRSGGIFNFLLRSKLTYYGDGDFRIPRS